jgi:aryl-alcohol dehydrogenase-like predicted oxidoreductase
LLVGRFLGGLSLWHQLLALERDERRDHCDHREADADPEGQPEAVRERSGAGDALREQVVRFHPISALQTEYSLWTRDPEDEVLPTVRELGIGFVAYSPLGRGFLSGQIRSPDDLDEDDFRRANPRFQGANFARNLEVVERVRAMADEKGVTASQLALAWVLSRGDDVVPIPGTKRRRYLEENVAPVEVELTPAEIDDIESVVPKGAIAGERYADMSSVGQ